MADLPPTDEAQLLATATEERASRWPMALRAFRHRDFALFWTGILISVMGTWMQMLAQGWLVTGMTRKPALYLGLVGVCSTLPMFVLTLPAGVIADRVRKRDLVLITQTLSMLQAFVLAYLVYTHTVRIWHVMLLAASLGAINAFDRPTRQAMTMELVGREDVLNAVSLNSSAFNSGRMVGPAVAGLLIAKAGIAGCFFINGLSFLAIIIALAFIPAHPPATTSHGAMGKGIREGVAWVRGEPVPSALLLFLAVSGIFIMPYTTLMPVFAKNILHAGPRGFGDLMSYAGFGALISAVLLAGLGHKWRLGLAATCGSLLLPVALLGLAGAPGYESAAVAMFCVGFGQMLFNAVSNSMLQTAPPGRLRGRVMSLRIFVFNGMSPLGSLQIGLIGAALGPRYAVGLGAALSLLTALVILWRVPRLRASETGL